MMCPEALSQFPWIVWMYSHIGEPEVTGEAPTAFDREVFSHTGYGSLGNTMESGCAATACAALEETGYTSTHSAAAISFKDYGTDCELKPGCICVFQWASGEHHISFCDHIVDGDNVACLGGNQSHEVKISIFPIAAIISTSWPVKA